MNSEKGNRSAQLSMKDHMKGTVPPFEELGSAERLQATCDFDELVKDTIFKFPKAVQGYDHNAVRPDGIELETLLKSSSGEDGSFVSICGRVVMLDNNIKKRTLSLQIIDGDGYGKEETREYCAEGSDYVYRRDSLGENEKNMSVDRRPVCAEEVAELRKLIESAEPRDTIRQESDIVNSEALYGPQPESFDDLLERYNRIKFEKNIGDIALGVADLKERIEKIRRRLDKTLVV